MTIHTLVLTVDSFSCNCNSIHSYVSIVLLRVISSFLFHCCVCINTTAFPIHLQFNFVQQCIQISTRINSSSVHMYICVCFIQNQYNTSNIQHTINYFYSPELARATISHWTKQAIQSEETRSNVWTSYNADGINDIDKSKYQVNDFSI